VEGDLQQLDREVVLEQELKSFERLLVEAASDQARVDIPLDLDDDHASSGV